MVKLVLFVAGPRVLFTIQEIQETIDGSPSASNMSLGTAFLSRQYFVGPSFILHRSPSRFADR